MDVEPAQRAMDQLGLRRRRPEAIARSRAAAVARAIDGDHAIALGGPRDQPGQHEVVDHRADAVHEDEGCALASLDVVEPDAIDVNEAATHAMCALGGLRAHCNECRRAERRTQHVAQFHGANRGNRRARCWSSRTMVCYAGLARNRA